MMPKSFISFLLSPKIDSFFRKLRIMNSKSGLFLSIMLIRSYMIPLFFIFLSICKSSAKFSNKWKATNRTFSYFFIIIANFLSSYFTISRISSYLSVPWAFWSSSILALYSLILTTYLFFSCSMILIVVSPI